MSCSRLRNLNPYDLHKTLINEYILTSSNRSSLSWRDTSRDKRDIDVIRENHQFLWDDNEDESDLSWGKKLARRYYSKLFKEYCIGDLSRYKENKIGMRWRTEKEVIDGKGQFICGCKTCVEKDDLRSWEVNFGYVENGVKKNALVKLRLCPKCSKKLNYHHKKKEIKRLKQSHPKSLKDVKTSFKANKSNESNESGEETQNESNSSNPSESEIWKGNTESNESEEKSREEEMDDYLCQLLL